jgi:hypothetical protein
MFSTACGFALGLKPVSAKPQAAHGNSRAETYINEEFFLSPNP